jgi:hypothetical protein
MGMIGNILGLGRVAGQVGEVAEVFVGNRAERDAADAARYGEALEQYAAEFAGKAAGPFDRFVDGLNRLPRPLLALGTIALFVHAMAAPLAFSARMQGLGAVPEPMWWLLGVIVSFYFGARELHHFRSRAGGTVAAAATAARTGLAAVQVNAAPAAFIGTPVPASVLGERPATDAVEVRAEDPDFNAAVEEWRRLSA